jgi:hypothetical protein
MRRRNHCPNPPLRTPNMTAGCHDDDRAMIAGVPGTTRIDLDERRARRGR